MADLRRVAVLLCAGAGLVLGSPGGFLGTPVALPAANETGEIGSEGADRTQEQGPDVPALASQTGAESAPAPSPATEAEILEMSEEATGLDEDQEDNAEDADSLELSNITLQSEAAYYPHYCMWMPWLPNCYRPPAPAPAPAPAPSPSRRRRRQNWGGSCSSYGCVDFNPGHSCQCNADCERYHSCCGDYHNRCQARHNNPAPAPAPSPSHSHGDHDSNVHKVLTLYHQTSDSICKLILANGFKPGTEGWCGGGIYFATSPQATETKAIGPESHKGCIIEARVDVGKIKYMTKTCDRQLTGTKVANQGYDSVSFNPGDGTEYVVYSPGRVVSTKRYS